MLGILQPSYMNELWEVMAKEGFQNDLIDCALRTKTREISKKDIQKKRLSWTVQRMCKKDGQNGNIAKSTIRRFRCDFEERVLHCRIEGRRKLTYTSLCNLLFDERWKSFSGDGGNPRSFDCRTIATALTYCGRFTCHPLLPKISSVSIRNAALLMHIVNRWHLQMAHAEGPNFNEQCETKITVSCYVEKVHFQVH